MIAFLLFHNRTHFTVYKNVEWPSTKAVSYWPVSLGGFREIGLVVCTRFAEDGRNDIHIIQKVHAKAVHVSKGKVTNLEDHKFMVCDMSMSTSF